MVPDSSERPARSTGTRSRCRRGPPGRGDGPNALLRLLDDDDTHPDASESFTSLSGIVLVVDDEPEIVALLSRILSKAGFKVLKTTSAREALEVATKHTEPIDLLLTDLLMPGMRGDQLAKEFLKVRPEARVIFVTACRLQDMEDCGLLDGETPILRKPFKAPQLLDTIATVLSAPTMVSPLS